MYWENTSMNIFPITNTHRKKTQIRVVLITITVPETQVHALMRRSSTVFVRTDLWIPSTGHQQSSFLNKCHFTCTKRTAGLNLLWRLQCCRFAVCLVLSVRSHLWLVSLCVDRLQPNVDTRQKQLAAWCSLALSYCRHHKLYTLDVMEAQESPVFNNKKIERILTAHLWFIWGQRISTYYTARPEMLTWIVYSKTRVSDSYWLSCLRRLFDLDH